MGEEDKVAEVSDLVSNGTVPVSEQTGETVTDKKVDAKDGTEEMVVDDKDETKGMEEDEKDINNVDKMNEDKPENKQIKESDEDKEQEEERDGKKEPEGLEPKSDAKEEKSEAEADDDREEEEEEEEEEGDEDVDEKLPAPAEEKDEPEDDIEEEHPKKPTKGKSSGRKDRKKEKEKKKKEPKTPPVPSIDRPVRERKSVERLVASIEKDAVREFHIEKGRGTALKDIPNVAYKLSKRKSDDTFKMLHTILFGRRGKAAQIRSNISRFSGFVWHENEEKQRTKVKEKLDKCVKEKLLDFCDVLDMPIAKSTTKKEDIVTKLIDFLVAPHATTTELLAEAEQSSKGKKRKRMNRGSASTSETPSKRLAKSRKTGTKGEKKRTSAQMEDNSEDEEEEEVEEEEHQEENVNGVPESSDDDMAEHDKNDEKENDSEDESEEETETKKKSSKKSSAKKESADKVSVKKDTTPKKHSSIPKKTSVKSQSGHPKVNNSRDTSPKIVTGKKKFETVPKKKSSTPVKPVSQEKVVKKVYKGKNKPKEEKVKLSDDELRNAIREILKEVDFNTATFTDILKQLAKQFNTDLTPRKSSIKLMIQDELTKLADEAEDDEDEVDAEKDAKQPSGQGVEA